MVNRYHELINKYIETDVLSSISSNNDFHCVGFLQDDGFGKAIHVDCMFVQYNQSNFGFEIAKEIIVSSFKYRFTHSIVYEKLETDTEEIIQNDIEEFFTSIDEMIKMAFVYFVAKYGRLQTGYKWFLTTSFYNYFASGFEYPDFEIPELQPIRKSWFYESLKLNDEIILDRAEMGIYFSEGFDNSYSMLLDVKDADHGFDKYYKYHEDMEQGNGDNFILESYKYINKNVVFLYNYLLACSYCNVKPKEQYKEHVVYQIAELLKKEDVSDLTVDYLSGLEKKWRAFMGLSGLFTCRNLHHVIINKFFELYNLLIQDEEKNIHDIWKIYMIALDTDHTYQWTFFVLDDEDLSDAYMTLLHGAASLLYKYRDIIDKENYSILRNASDQYFSDRYSTTIERDLNYIGINTLINRVATSYDESLFYHDILCNNYDNLITMLYRFNTHIVKEKLLSQKIDGFYSDFAQCIVMLFYINGDYDTARELSNKLNIKPKEISKLIDIAEGKADFELVEIDGKLKNLYQNYYTLVGSLDADSLDSSYIFDNYPQLNHMPKFEIISEIADQHSNETSNSTSASQSNEGVIVSSSPYFA